MKYARDTLYFRLSLALVCAGVLLVSIPQPAESQALSFRRGSIGTNPVGSAFHVIGGALAKLLTEKAGVLVIVQPQAGSSVSVPLISNGEMTMAVVNALDSGLHYRGDDGKPYPKLRALVQLTAWPYGFMVLENSGIKKISELKGKRVAFELKGNKALENANRAILAVGGLKESDIQSVTVTGLPAGIRAVGEGVLDAAPVLTVGMPLVQELAVTVPGGVRILTFDGPNANDEFVSNLLPGAYILTINPAPNAPGVHKDTKVLGYDIFLVASADMSDADASAIVSLIIQNWEQLRKEYSQIAGTELKALARPTNAIPYHPGAIAAFRKAGFWTDANDAQEKRLEAKTKK